MQKEHSADFNIQGQDTNGLLYQAKTSQVRGSLAGNTELLKSKYTRMLSLALHMISSVQSLSRVWLFVTPWTEACQTSLSITNSQSLLKFMSTGLVMPSNRLILCHPLLLPASIFPSIRVFSNKLVLHIRWPKYWSFSFSMPFQWIFRNDFL